MKWIKPSNEWNKLNTDNSTFDNLGLVGGEGLLRNSQGHSIRGFARLMERTTCVIVKLYALKDGLTLSLLLSFTSIYIELDVEIIVQTL